MIGDIVPNCRVNRAYFGDHHVAVKCSFAVGARRAVDVWADFGDYGGAKSHVWHEVAVHDIDLQSSQSIALLYQLISISSVHGASRHLAR